MYERSSANGLSSGGEAGARLSHEARALAILNDVGSRLWQMRDLEEGLRMALEATVELLGAAMGNIQLSGSGNVLRLVAQVGFDPDAVADLKEVSPADDWVCAHAMRSRTRIVIEDIEKEDSALLRALGRSAGFRAVQSTPMIGRNGALLGMISTHFSQPRTLMPSEEGFLDLYARQIADFIERWSVDEKLRRLNQDQAHLAAIVESSDDAIVSKDLNATILTWNKGAERLFGYSADEAVGRSITMLIPEDRLDEEPQILARLRAGERVEHFETVRRHKSGRPIDISLTISPVRNAAGEIVAASKIARDISERKRGEAQRALLLAELNHRVKNTLATVVSIARQSFSGVDTAGAREAFDARIRALAQTHGKLADSSWTSVSLEALLRDEFAPYTQAKRRNVRLCGPPVAMGPRCALTLGLALHELVTNAAKYGALAAAAGEVDVSWKLENGFLAIDWRERNGPLVAAPARSGFGRLLLEKVVAAELNCEVKLDFAPEGLHCLLRLPERHCVAEAQ